MSEQCGNKSLSSIMLCSAGQGDAIICSCTVQIDLHGRG